MKRILYYGGSITCGFDATDYEHSWAKRSNDRIAHELYGAYLSFFRRASLGWGKHRAVIEVLEKNEKVLGSQVMIAGVFAG